MLLADSFFHHWVWPAEGPGGIPGDVAATFVWVLIAGLVTVLVWPPIRRQVETIIKRHTAELHLKMDHIIKHHPDIPDLPKEAPDGETTEQG
jgi:hypothetical protein